MEGLAELSIKYPSSQAKQLEAVHVRQPSLSEQFLQVWVVVSR